MGGQRWNVIRAGSGASLLCVLGAVWALPAVARAQFQMPDPKQMAGIPRPVSDLPDGTVSVRLIRGSLSNNLKGQGVELHAGSRTLEAKTDDAGRAEFKGVAEGTTVKAVAEVDGERLESQEFPFPGKGGIRLLLVATDKAAAAAPPVTGQVTLGSQTRIVMEPGDESVQLYYLLSIQNSGAAPVNPPKTFTFDMPTGALGSSLLRGSSPQAAVTGTHVRVQGPFAPGTTAVQVACELPSSSGTLEITQQFPAQLEQFAVVVKKLGDTKLSSPLIAQQKDLSADGEAYIAASGAAVPADRPISLVLYDLPHHSAAPRVVALVLAVAIVLAGVWASSRKPEGEPGRVAERKRLVARREKLLADLVRLERDHLSGRGDRTRYAARREELIAALELVYGALDGDDTDPASADRAGRAA
jgi:hypothetical protein